EDSKGLVGTSESDEDVVGDLFGLFRPSFDHVLIEEVAERFFEGIESADKRTDFTGMANDALDVLLQYRFQLHVMEV
ncbi:MAG: hypothetical protein ACOVNV_05040, partial [Pirellulaceae bacterium]